MVYKKKSRLGGKKSKSNVSTCVSLDNIDETPLVFRSGRADKSMFS